MLTEEAVYFVCGCPACLSYTTACRAVCGSVHFAKLTGKPELYILFFSVGRLRARPLGEGIAPGSGAPPPPPLPQRGPEQGAERDTYLISELSNPTKMATGKSAPAALLIRRNAPAVEGAASTATAAYSSVPES